MNWKFLISLTLLATVTLPFPRLIAQAPSRSFGIERVSWLEGCWALMSGGRDVEEHWMAPKGASMLGIGRTVRNGVLADYEMMLIRQTDDGLVFEAHPANQPAARFSAIDVGSSRVVFENLEHDFPQRIGYERSGNKLLAWIEGLQKGQRRRIEFPYTRSSCGRA